MPEAELEVVNKVYEAFADRRFPEELFADDVEWKTWEDLPDADTHRGIEQVRNFFSEWVAGWAEVRSEVETLIDAGPKVVALIHGSFRLLEGSQPLESDYAHVWTVRDGQVQRVEAVDRAEGLRLAREA